MEIVSQAAIRQFVEQCVAVSLPDHLPDLGREICSLMDFETFNFLLCFRNSAPRRQIVVSNGPRQWSSHYYERRYSAIDPVARYCRTRSLPLQLNQARLPIDASKAVCDQFLVDCRTYGLEHGLALPLHGHGEWGMLILTRYDKAGAERYARSAMPYAMLLSAHFHETVRRVIGNGHSVARSRLTKREKEALHWTAEGKTSWEIACILGISERTVVSHLQNAMEKLDAANRTHAAVKAAALFEHEQDFQVDQDAAHQSTTIIIAEEKRRI